MGQEQFILINNMPGQRDRIVPLFDFIPLDQVIADTLHLFL